MFSSSSPANLKIVGIEGHSPESLREAVDRGAKFVIYSYNFSLLVMSFKRPSNIHFIRPGESRVVKGLPFTLISLVFGWWGIPWGIVFTIQSLHANLTGGKDVTADLMASLAPDKSQTSGAGNAVPPPPLRPAPSPVSGRRILTGLAVLAAVGAVAYPIICVFYGENLKVALVSGLPAPYPIELNGTPHKLSAKHPEVLTLAEGDFVLRGAPGTKEELRFSARTPFWTRPFDHHVLVINPDQVAIAYRETVTYHPTGTPNDPNEKGTYQVFANHPFHFIPDADYFFEDFPEKISMPSGTSSLQKTRIGAFEDFEIESQATLIGDKLGSEALRDFLSLQARHQPENDRLHRQIYLRLKPDDARKLFESHLKDRPVLVEWHRAYQSLMDQHFHAVDLTAFYRTAMAADPDDGALIYLHARTLQDPKIAHPLYEKALHAKRTTPYAAYALGVDEFSEGRYAPGLEFFLQAEHDGLHSESLQLRKHDTQFALGRFDDVLADLHQSRVKVPTDSELFVSELQLAQTLTPNPATGQRAIASFLAGLRSRYGANGDYKPLEGYLNAQLIYALGEEREFAATKLKGTNNVFQASVSRRDHRAAAQALNAEKHLPVHYYWMLLLTAQSAGDSAAADTYFKKILAELNDGDSSSRAIARQITEDTAVSHAATLRTFGYAAELRVMFTALGVRFPAQREMYFARARELDHDPAFPHLLLQAVRKDTGAVTKL